MNTSMETFANAERAGKPLPGIGQFSNEQRIEMLEQEVRQLRGAVPNANKVTLLIFSGDQDKVLAGLTIATTAASMGMDATLFFTFWGVNVLKRQRLYAGKDIKEKMIDFMTPAGATRMGVSKLNMFGMGAGMLQQMMKDKNIVSADELLGLAQESGVKLMVCSMTLQVMGLKPEELMDGIEVAGAASYLTEAAKSGCTLFI